MRFESVGWDNMTTTYDERLPLFGCRTSSAIEGQNNAMALSVFRKSLPFSPIVQYFKYVAHLIEVNC